MERMVVQTSCNNLQYSCLEPSEEEVEYTENAAEDLVSVDLTDHSKFTSSALSVPNAWLCTLGLYINKIDFLQYLRCYLLEVLQTWTKSSTH